jgi:mRNA interferase HicA
MKSSELLRLLKKDGWFEVRQHGTSHIIMRHEIKSGQLTVPANGTKEVRKGTLRAILKEAQIETNKR